MLIVNCIIFGLFIIWTLVGFRLGDRNAPEWFVFAWGALAVLSGYALGLLGGLGTREGTILGELLGLF